jgi:hypothetical protein
MIYPVIPAEREAREPVSMDTIMAVNWRWRTHVEFRVHGSRLGAAFRRLGRDDSWRAQLIRFMEALL